MTNKINLAVLMSGAFVGQFATDLFTKILVTCLAMLIGTTFGFYWRKYLEHMESCEPKKSRVFSRIKKIKAALKKWDEDFSKDDDKNNTDGV